MAYSERVKQAKLAALRQRRGRRRGGGSNRLPRTILLGTAAVVFALWWLVREFELDVDELLGFLGVSLMFVLGAALLGMVGFGLLLLLRRLCGKPPADSLRGPDEEPR